MSRPEYLAPPEIYYDDQQAKKYLTNTRINEVQRSLTERALELLCLRPNQKSLLLDLGCGSGLSGDVITEEGHEWVGFDISQAMLDTASSRDVEGDLVLLDLGQGLPLRTGIFDGAISVSAIQWLCNADKTSYEPRKRMSSFFNSLYACLIRGSRAVLQFYPDSSDQVDLLLTAAQKAGFSGGLVVDFPNSTRAKKFFLCLTAGPPSSSLATNDKRVNNYETSKGKKRNNGISLRSKILAKKERQRRQGREVRPDSKYTGRKRSGKLR
ncbi:methyltransferase [Galdieria sulphuraria]|uniref:Methyltransferase n=1 Tax=Galdieria sulphuraria TaxID=130081 RepID=M2VYE1_GALSU|nr:methyltransferase [Galdieria sulphuraria]EME28311.1 methyltransferase [Galdieria sulphuraria]|eukprot:XP_005704831.1 methyltransferase [Galdieria sulphuraria]